MPSRSNENPYYLGNRKTVYDLPVLCSCCGLTFLRKDVHAWTNRLHCDICREHFEIIGESAERREHRLVTDRQRVAERADQMRAMLDRNEAQLKQQRERVASALSSRDFWKAQIEAVEKLHHPNDRGSCVCGKRPCPVIEAIDGARRRSWDD